MKGKLLSNVVILMLLIGSVASIINLTPTVSGNSDYKWLTIKYSPDPMAWNGYEVVPNILPPPGTHNYTLNSMINVTAPLVVNVTNDVRYVFDHWEVYLEESNTTKTATVNSITVKMDENKTATAYYRIQYLFTVVTAFDKPYIWYGGAWHQESSHWFDEYAITYASVTKEHVDLNFSMKAKFVEWTGDWTGKEIRPNGRVRAGPINMTGPKTVVANWVIEYFLTKDSVYDPWSPSVPYAIGKYYTSVEKAIDRIVALQSSSDYGWDWIVTDQTSHSGNPSGVNLYGIIGLGLLDAFELTENMTYFFAAQKVADYLTSGPMPLHGHGYGPDYMFLVRFSEVSGRPEYKDYAIKAWNWQKANWGRYADGNQTYLYNYFYNNWVPSHGIVIWNTAFYALGAYYLGDIEWAENMTKVIAANFTKITNDGYQYIGWGNALRLFQTIDPVGYATEIESAVNSLKSSQTYSGCWPGGWTQDAAYAIMGLAAVGEMEAAEKGADWLVSTQGYNSIAGGWKQPDGEEYSEVTSEAAQALAAVAKCWYEEGTDVELTAPEYVNVNPNHWRWRFDYWTVETWNGTAWVNPQNFTTRTITIHMNAPMKATVHFWLQYYLTVTDNLPSIDTGVENQSGYYDYCSNVTLYIPTGKEFFDLGGGVGYGFYDWWVKGIIWTRNDTVTIHIKGEYTAKAEYKTMYRLNLFTSPPEAPDEPDFLYPDSDLSGWYFAGTSVSIKALPLIQIDATSRWKFTKWTAPDWLPGWEWTQTNFTVPMDRPKNFTANYDLEYYAYWDCSPAGVVPGWPGEKWVKNGTYIGWSAPQFIPGTTYVFHHWVVNNVTYDVGKNDLSPLLVTGPIYGTAYYVNKTKIFMTPSRVEFKGHSYCEKFNVTIYAANFDSKRLVSGKAMDIYGFEIKIDFDPSLIQIQDVYLYLDEFFESKDYTVWIEEVDNTAGYYQIVASMLGNYTGFEGTRPMFTLTFHVAYDPCYPQCNATWIRFSYLRLINHEDEVIYPELGPYHCYYIIKSVKPVIELRDASDGDNTVIVHKNAPEPTYFNVEVWLLDGVKVHDYYVKIDYDESQIEAVDVTIGDYLKPPYTTYYWTINKGSGYVVVKVAQDPSVPLQNCSGILFTITFKVIKTIFYTIPGPHHLTSKIKVEEAWLSVKCPDPRRQEYPVHLGAIKLDYVYNPLPGDLDADGQVTVLDIQLIVDTYGLPDYDITGDGKGDIRDIVFVALRLGTKVE